jgi:cytochrome c oxidase assembly protein Cox11
MTTQRMTSVDLIKFDRETVSKEIDIRTSSKNNPILRWNIQSNSAKLNVFYGFVAQLTQKVYKAERILKINN